MRFTDIILLYRKNIKFFGGQNDADHKSTGI